MKPEEELEPESGLNKKLSEILAGIIVSGIIIQALFFVVAYFYRQFLSNSASFAAGLWIGVATSSVLAVHTYRSIAHALEMEQDEAERYMHRVYMIRAIVIAAMAGMIWYTRVGSVMASFLGVF
ncbi:MAG: hypothetical protein LUI07_06435, partial [Lachnospiraceae bacterium]|nr:hypothetical protein [Lachnospiraceae bacterium]